MSENVKYFIEVCFGIAMFASSFLFLPQIIKLYRSKKTEGLSLVTFAGFNIMQIFGILHGYIRKDYTFMFGMAISLVLCGILTFLIIFYKILQKKNRKI